LLWEDFIDPYRLSERRHARKKETIKKILVPFDH